MTQHPPHTTAQLCDHTWPTGGHYRWHGHREHECLRHAGHDICRCRCGEAVTTPARCGATTTRKGER